MFCRSASLGLALDSLSRLPPPAPPPWRLPKKPSTNAALPIAEAWCE